MLAPIDNIIDSISKTVDVIFISEDHTSPPHRLFTKELCKKLFHNGYEILCIEPLLLKGDSIYPIHDVCKDDVFELGTEVCYHELFVIANQIGMKIFPFNYDIKYHNIDTVENDKKITYSYYNNNLVEKTTLSLGDSLIEYRILSNPRCDYAVANLLKIKKANPNKKMIVLMGLSHAKRYKNSEAGKFENISNSKTLCIDQVMFDEGCNGIYRFDNIKDSISKYTTPMIVCAKGNVHSTPPYINKNYNNKSDVYIIHPPTTFIENRPNWFISDEDREKYAIPKKYAKNLTSIQVFIKSEYEKYGVKAIPIEMINSNFSQLYLIKKQSHVVVYSYNNGKKRIKWI